MMQRGGNARLVLLTVCMFAVVIVWARMNGTALKFVIAADNQLSRVSLPLSHLTHSYDILVETSWYNDVHRFLSQLTNNDIILIACDIEFLPVLMNWLSAYRKTTQSLLTEVLILALDNTVHTTLSTKGFNSIFIINDDIFIPNIKLNSVFSHIWIKRLTVARLLNHYGYNIIIMDLDAIILKDIVSLMKEKSSDIIGSKGVYPFALRNEWGFTLCMGTVMFKSTSQTEKFWNAFSNMASNSEDDQVLINTVFHHNNVEWNIDPYCTKDKLRCTHTGHVKDSIFNVTLLSQDIVCRQCHKRKRSTYFVWHGRAKRTGKEKEEKAREGHAWFLETEWKRIFDSSEDKGVLLIDQITAQHTNRSFTTG